MKKNFLFLGALIALTISVKGQSTPTVAGAVVVYIPDRGITYEARSIETSSVGNTITLKMTHPVIIPTPNPHSLRIKPTDCTRGALIDVNTQGGTHNVTCDETVNETCYCAGSKRQN